MSIEVLGVRFLLLYLEVLLVRNCCYPCPSNNNF